MTPKDLEHWERIFKAGERAAGGCDTWDDALLLALEAMSSECKRLLDEENERDRTEWS